jgi:hypothetical protein
MNEKTYRKQTVAKAGPFGETEGVFPQSEFNIVAEKRL